MYRKKPQGWMKHIDFILLDFLAMWVAFFLACLTYHGAGAFQQLEHYMSIMCVFALVSVLLHVGNNTFSNVLKRSWKTEFFTTVRHVFVVELVITFFLFSIKQSTNYSRVVIYLLAIYYALISFGGRLIWKRLIRKKGYLFKSAALHIITTRDRAEATVENIRFRAKGEYTIQGLCILDEHCVGSCISGVEVTSDGASVLQFLRDKWVDEVYVSGAWGQEGLKSIVDGLTEMGMVVHVELQDIGGEDWQIRQEQRVADKPVCTISMTSISFWQAFVKRVIDIIGGLVGCVFTLLLTLILGPLICIQSPGPIFFTQTRVGKNGKKFKMYKFRSMYPDAEDRKAALMAENRVKDGMMFKLEADPRIIGCKILPDGTLKKGIGNFIRDYSLDEFPQFFNVLKGDLSLCGTRPPTVDEWEKYKLHHRARLAIKPGITGLWQVSGRSNITDFEDVVELDKKYIRQWSIGLDVKIIFKTIFVVFRKEGSM